MGLCKICPECGKVVEIYSKVGVVTEAAGGELVPSIVPGHFVGTLQGCPKCKVWWAPTDPPIDHAFEAAVRALYNASVEWDFAGAPGSRPQNEIEGDLAEAMLPFRVALDGKGTVTLAQAIGGMVKRAQKEAVRAERERASAVVRVIEGEFTSFQQWVNKASSWLSGRNSTCVDAKGRRCLIGLDFMRARDEGAFPVRYAYAVPAVDVPDDHPVAMREAARLARDEGALLDDDE